MSMTWVIPSRATFPIFSEFQIPPPTAIRSVSQVISIRLSAHIFVGTNAFVRPPKRSEDSFRAPTHTATRSRSTAPPILRYEPPQRLCGGGRLRPPPERSEGRLPLCSSVPSVVSPGCRPFSDQRRSLPIPPSAPP